MAKAGLSFYIVATYLGKDWFLENIVNPRHAFCFMSELHGKSDNSAFQDTIGILADTIYDLQDAEGFGQWAQRLKQKDLDSAFCEACAASLLREMGHKIRFIPKKNIKGEDYDFESEFGGTRFAVEAKSRLESAQKYPRFKSIYNALEEARRSLRRGSAGIIVLFLPRMWIRFPLIRQIVDVATEKLWRSSSHVEFVMPVWFESLESDSPQWGHIMKYRLYKNYRVSEKRSFVRPYYELAPRGDFHFWADLQEYRAKLDRPGGRPQQ
jgi:hypothetical protein